MHELAVCESILQQVLVVAAAHSGSEISRIKLRIGPLSGVEPALVKRAFPVVASGTACENAELCIDDIVVTVFCRACGLTSETPPNRLVCAGCGTWRVTLMSGDEMRLESFDLLESNKMELEDV